MVKMQLLPHNLYPCAIIFMDSAGGYIYRSIGDWCCIRLWGIFVV